MILNLFEHKNKEKKGAKNKAQLWINYSKLTESNRKCTFVLNPKLNSLDLNEELDALTDQLLEVSMKLKAAESELKALRSEQVKELSKFSHNLKNPVGVISSFAEMLQGSGSIDEEKRAKYLDIIQTSSKFSLALVNSFQEYNKLKNAQVPFEIEQVNYVNFIQEIVGDFNKVVKKRNQSIEFNFSCASDSIVKIDRTQIHKAITNILDNASRFSSEASVISVVVEESENSLITKIADTGIGVSDGDLPNLINPFFTVNTYDEFKGKCIGLGLTKTNLILSQLNGKISVESKLESGTNVEITFKKE